MRVQIITITALFLLRGPAVFAQHWVDAYVQEALSNNLVLKEKNVGLDKSLLALKEARSMFLPVTQFDGQYSLAQGGRSIDIPVGDLLNPVYQTLNQLTSSNNFPTIKNVSEQLNPNNFYDLRIRTTMPIINPAIKANNRIKEQEIKMQENDVSVYKRELVKQVKQAYFNVLMTGKEIEIYRNALVVVNQNLRVNQSLLSNGKGLPAYVSRAESEVKQVESQLQNAMNSQQNALAYFNFLRNKSLTDSIPVGDTVYDYDEELRALIWNKSTDISGREELKSLSVAKVINQQVLKLNRSYSTPRLNAFLDLAAQGFDFRINSRSFFYLGGLQLQVPIFTGKRNIYRIEQTRFDSQSLELTADQTRQQLELASLVSRNNIVTAYNSYQSAIKQEDAARKYFKLIDRGYQEGVNTFIEFLDARNQLTRSQLQTNLNKYKVLATLADFERQTAAYSFN
ncbi:TolC family protein [Flavihumibacter fluvii]|uniref:TolC family protein n=1 Tax=Flavihumibacter fluvii TaxID=2838157 RepID=UPI001BDE33FA|nr:TolC family protein [Flavihumibacter fluvii]ULQ54640.1 TolC family protein [Flavihumibacter fluvii]